MAFAYEVKSTKVTRVVSATSVEVASRQFSRAMRAYNRRRPWPEHLPTQSVEVRLLNPKPIIGDRNWMVYKESQ